MFDNERARMELYRMDGVDEVAAVSAEEAVYDGTLPVRTFAKLCAGAPVVNPANAENGARVTEALDALYRSAASGLVERV